MLKILLFTVILGASGLASPGLAASGTALRGLGAQGTAWPIFIQANADAEERPDQAAPDMAVHPQATSKQELDDFNAAQSVIGANSAEIAANDFAAKYSASELRIYLYNRAMYAYQSENNPPKLLAMAQKVLSIDPDHPVALVLTAYVLADGMEDNDPDHVRKVEEIKRAGNRAIKVLGSAAPLPLSATPEELPLYRTTLQSMAYSALGMMKLKTGDDAGAEKDLLMAAGLPQTHPDPYLWYHLALAQDHRKKYAAALSSVNQALQLSSSNPDLQRMAEIEHDRLSGVSRGRDQGTTGAEPPQ
jgi:tetratricopeptide (TPR) repeat protein